MPEQHPHRRRIAALQARLLQEDCDAFFSVAPADNAYLTGFFGSTSAVLVTRTAAFLLCDFRYIEQASALSSVDEVMECAGSLDVRLAEKIAGLGVRRAAFDPDTLSVARHGVIQDACGCGLVGRQGFCARLREVKDSGEIARIAEAVRLAEDALECTLSGLCVGVTECETAATLEHEFRKRGAARASFDTIVLFGERSSLPHGMPGSRPLRAGDIVLIDCGCVLDGYCSDLTRTFVFGRIPGTWFTEIYETVRLAQQAAVERVGPGLAAKAVDHAARAPIADAGYASQFGHGTGHGVGLEVHEAPRLNAQSTAVLASGMAVTVEPGIYLPGRGGVRIEDLVAVNEDGCSVLTTIPKELRIL